MSRVSIALGPEEAAQIGLRTVQWHMKALRAEL